MAKFSNVKYETNSGLVVFLRIETAAVSVVGTAPAGDPDINIHGIVNGNRSREFGIHPRGVSLFRERGTGNDTFKSYKFLPVLTQAALDGGGFDIGDSISIGGTSWTVGDQVGEDLN